MSDDSPDDPKSSDAGKTADDRHGTPPSPQPSPRSVESAPSEKPAAEAKAEEPEARPLTHERFAKAAASRHTPASASSESEAPGPDAPGTAAASAATSGTGDAGADAIGSETVTESLIDYRALIQRALRAVVHDTLLQVSMQGLPGDHHFYIDFETQATGTQVPAALRQEFPELMRIVLQRQFWNLAVDDDGFEVDLRFGGRGTHLRVPFDAVTAFVDPAANLVLRFDPETVEDDAPEDASPEEMPTAGTDDRPKGDAEVVSIDAFRNRDT